ncbi:hypothetical protein BT63DRAFT_422071 [Microthyrium microscopicum]|uniref:non-specific serine/threonine protein kinase n=1 Tax=Microthyrium microscopicum TaxID=703497 RepID=A0A6A6UNU4_9PEZI|nr:hypothetical protein BT63DRAFT_422071 [Microthyrium microscopicum]
MAPPVPKANPAPAEPTYAIPPSTIAAQILRNGNTATAQINRAAQREAFDKLLAEFLSDPIVDLTDENIQDNVRFVTFLVEAAGESRNQKELFSPKDLDAQAADCLRAVRITIQKQPELLMFSEDSQDEERPPFICWLLTSLLSIGSRERLTDVWTQLLQALSACTSSLLSKPTTWLIGQEVVELLQSIAENLRQSLESFAGTKPFQLSSYRATCPPTKAISKFWASEQSIALPPGYQLTLKRPNDANNILLLIIISFSDQVIHSKSLDSEKLPWILDLAHSVVDFYRALRQHRCLDRRRIVTSLITLACDILLKDSRRWCLQRSVDLIEKLLVLVSPPDGEDVQISLAHSLLLIMQNAKLDQSGVSKWLRALKDTTSIWPRLCSDLQNAVDIFLRSPQNVSDHNDTESDGDQDQFIDKRLTETFESLRVNLPTRQTKRNSEDPDVSRPEKRRKISETAAEEEATDTTCTRLVKSITEAFNSESPITTIQDISVFELKDNSDDGVASLIQSLKNLPCAASGAWIDETLEEQYPTGCRICDEAYSTDSAPDEGWPWDSEEECQAFHQMLTELLGFTNVKNSRLLRITTVQTIGRFVKHISDPGYLDIRTDPLARFCMKSLQSTSHELRIVSSQALLGYLRGELDSKIMHLNRNFLLEMLRELNSRDNLALLETLLYLWTQIGIVCGETELNIALLELVNALGHPHMIICGVAYMSIRRLAKATSQSVAQLFAPFWRNIAPSVVRDVLSCPQKAQQLSELLQLKGGVDELLVLTQTETVPYMILTKRHDILARIVDARPDISSIEALIMEPKRNLACVLSKLLLEVDGSEPKAASLLQEAAPHLKGKFTELVQLEPNNTACEILKTAPDYGTSTLEAKDTAEAKVDQAFKLLAKIAMSSKNTSKRSVDLMSLFMEEYVLGIMAHFTDIVDNSKERQPLSEKVRALQAIEFLMAVSDQSVDLALPQMRATLQSALDSTNLIDAAFAAWIALMNNTGDESFKELIPHTFAIVVQKWEVLSPYSQERGYLLITQLVSRYNQQIMDNVAMIPSLAGIDLFNKLAGEISAHKNKLEPEKLLDAFSKRCSNDNVLVVRQALRELVPYLVKQQGYIHENAQGQQPIPAIAALYRTLLDASMRFKELDDEVVDLCARALGVLGCIDPNQVETVREKHSLLVLSNFEKPSEIIEFIAQLLETVLVPAFRSAPTGKQQSYLAYVMQELLKISGFSDAVINTRKGSPPRQALQRWKVFPESVQSTLTPYLNSKYHLTNPTAATELVAFPPSGPTPPHGTWLRTLVFGLLHRPNGKNAKVIFPKISRVILNHDLSIATFMLPFVVQTIVTGGTDEEIDWLCYEFSNIMKYDVISPGGETERENIKQCSYNVFQVFDYLNRWVQEKSKMLAKYTARNRHNDVPEDFDAMKETREISQVQRIFDSVPQNVTALRAFICENLPRSVYHYEQHMKSMDMEDVDFEFQQLQLIYEEIKEPDGVDGISSKLRLLDVAQQVVDHKQAGRWTAALTYFDLAVREYPEDTDLQLDLLCCLKASGQYNTLLNSYDMFKSLSSDAPILAAPFAVEAAWTINNWDKLASILAEDQIASSSDFDLCLGKALVALRQEDQTKFLSIISETRSNISKAMSHTNTASLSSAHALLIKLHAVHELEYLSGYGTITTDTTAILQSLRGRLDIVGSFTEDKAYILAVRRAAMSLSNFNFSNREIATEWLVSSRLARKANRMDAAYDSVMRAAMLGDPASYIETARLLWKSGSYRKAIQQLQHAIADGSFVTYAQPNIADSVTVTTVSKNRSSNENVLLAKTQLLLAKWTGISGQEKSNDVLAFYKASTDTYNKWDKGHYFLGAYYNKILDSEKAAPENRQTVTYLNGECTKLTIDNYLRSMLFGPKYLYRTLPKVLTLWLDFAQDQQAQLQAQQAHGRRKTAKAAIDNFFHERQERLAQMNSQIEKYLLKRTPSYITYTAFAQLLSRINNPHPQTSKLLAEIIVHVVQNHPRQSLWSLLSVSRSSSDEKSRSGRQILSAVIQRPFESGSLKELARSAEFLTECLLEVCQVGVDNKTAYVSLSKQLKFRRSLDDACGLVIPFRKTLQATLASVPGVHAMRKNTPFPHEGITINGFEDQVLVLSSLQKPRKLVIRGADGNTYPILCKPKDDLRKDQRLMEFNLMIDRALKRDIDAAKRKLYIKTYAVTTLNDEHGVLEWVDGLKALRDIITGLLSRDGIRVDYNGVKSMMDKALTNKLDGHTVFTDKVLPMYPPQLYKWFLETFLEPETWFDARLRYTRSCAVMSIVGSALGLGDRHGENISIEQGSGGVFHVDFNCLFEKGLTFDKPELVPFRLTHNMVDAFGVYGYEGPFRKAAETTQRILKQYEDTLMTIMESFIYDPTTDFIGAKRPRIPGVPETPAEILSNVKSKFNCMFKGETVPMSVEGYVDALIRMAVDPRNLMAMYVGWCAFL